MKSRVLSLHTHIELFWIMGFISLSCIAMYMYFIKETIHQVAERQVYEQELSERTAKIGELEFEYISLSNTIDLALAKELGFEESNPKAFVSQKSSVALANSSSLSQ